MLFRSGDAADVSSTLVLDWNFVDSDPSDTQSAYAVSRQIGAGSLTYWRASDSTWQATEQKNTSATTGLSLATSWASASDAAHTFKVKVWDTPDAASGYSSGFIVIPSARVNPSFVAPTADQVITISSIFIDWTASEQTAFKVTLESNPGAVIMYNSGWVNSTTTEFTPPFTLVDNKIGRASWRERV